MFKVKLPNFRFINSGAKKERFVVIRKKSVSHYNWIK